MKKEIRLYNILFPVWILIIFPLSWFIIIPGNFLIDSLVVYIGLRYLKINRKKEFYQKTIFWVFLFGFIADIIGSLLILASQWLFQKGFLYEYIAEPIAMNPFDNIYCLLYLLIAVAVTGVLIYVFNYYISFRVIIIKNVKRVMALLLAVLTAPYLFLLPTVSFYGGKSENFTNHIVWSEYVSSDFYVGEDENGVDLTESENGKKHAYSLASLLKEGINTAKKTKKSFDSKADYTVVFLTNEQNGEKLTPIKIWKEDNVLYFEWKDKMYVIKDEYGKDIIAEIDELIEKTA